MRAGLGAGKSDFPSSWHCRKTGEDISLPCWRVGLLIADGRLAYRVQAAQVATLLAWRLQNRHKQTHTRKQS